MSLETQSRPIALSAARVTPLVQTLLAPVTLGLLGLMLAHGPSIVSGLRQVQVAATDGRLVHFLLEHSWRCLRADPLHRDFWNPPFYYPATNAAAYSDALVTAAPPYWLARAIGFPPHAAFGAWFLAVSVINYLGALLLLGRALAYPPLAAALGAFLFAFAAPRVNQSLHPQLWPQGFTLLALYGLARLFGTARPNNPLTRLAWWLTVALALAAQLYASFYLGAFAGLGLTCAFVAALVLPRLRPRLLQVLHADAFSITFAGLVGVVTLAPFLTHYLQAAREVGPRWWQGVLALMPSFPAWLNVGADHVVYGSLLGWGPFPRLQNDWEHRLGLGLITPLAAAAGLWLGRSRPVVALSSTTVLGLVMLTTPLPISLDTLRNITAAVAIGGY